MNRDVESVETSRLDVVELAYADTDPNLFHHCLTIFFQSDDFYWLAHCCSSIIRMSSIMEEHRKREFGHGNYGSSMAIFWVFSFPRNLLPAKCLIFFVARDIYRFSPFKVRKFIEKKKKRNGDEITVEWAVIP